MLDLNLYFWYAVLILYGINSFLYVIALKTNEAKWARIAAYFTYAVLGAHTLTLLIRWQEAQHAPLVSFYEVMSFFAWAIVALYLILKFRYDIHSLGAFVVPLAFLAMLYALTLPMDIKPLPPVLQSKWLEIHIVITFFAYAAFALAAALAIMYLILEKQIKSKRPHAFYYRLPSLEILDALNHRLISIGFPLLTIGIIIGVFWGQEAWGTYWRWESKETWALISWILYATYLHGRVALGWRGKKSAYWSVVGLAAIIFTYLGVNLLGGGLHVSLENLP